MVPFSERNIDDSIVEQKFLFQFWKSQYLPFPSEEEKYRGDPINRVAWTYSPFLTRKRGLGFMRHSDSAANDCGSLSASIDR